MSCEIAELENSVAHLVRMQAVDDSPSIPQPLLITPHRTALQKRSNEELAAALAAAPEDNDFQEALAENKMVIQKKENLLVELKKELQAHKSLLVTALGAAEARQLPAAVAIETEAASARADIVAASAAAAQASHHPVGGGQEQEEEEKEGGVYL